MCVNDVIRIDQDELIVLAKGLRQLDEEMELLRSEIRLSQYHLSGKELQLIEMQLMNIQRRMDDTMQQIRMVAEDIILLTDKFSRCEHFVKQYFIMKHFGMNTYDSGFTPYGRKEYINAIHT